MRKANKNKVVWGGRSQGWEIREIPDGYALYRWGYPANSGPYTKPCWVLTGEYDLIILAKEAMRDLEAAAQRYEDSW